MTAWMKAGECWGTGHNLAFVAIPFGATSAGIEAVNAVKRR